MNKELSKEEATQNNFGDTSFDVVLTDSLHHLHLHVEAARKCRVSFGCLFNGFPRSRLVREGLRRSLSRH